MIEFFKKYGADIFIVIMVIVLIVVFFLPLGIGIAKELWKWALCV